MLPPAQRHEAEREHGEEEHRAAHRAAQQQDGGDRAEEADERGVRGVEEAAAAVEERVEHARRDHGRDAEEGHASHDEVAKVRRALLAVCSSSGSGIFGCGDEEERGREEGF